MPQSHLDITLIHIPRQVVGLMETFDPKAAAATHANAAPDFIERVKSSSVSTARVRGLCICACRVVELW